MNRARDEGAVPIPGTAGHTTGAAFLLTARAAKLCAHPGQLALPRGRVDAGETIEQAGLRELSEEHHLADSAHSFLEHLLTLSRCFDPRLSPDQPCALVKGGVLERQANFDMRRARSGRVRMRRGARQSARTTKRNIATAAARITAIPPSALMGLLAKVPVGNSLRDRSSLTQGEDGG
ncbi:MAG TPA: NUDIX domain-containing protein [Stellaceae bacterium]|nr:NUDIX domain-containing protein [Stellaceae bacterium]